ncbi:MAG: hypothetical protein ACJ8C4_16320 [Gemmataceae bacterium]
MTPHDRSLRPRYVPPINDSQLRLFACRPDKDPGPWAYYKLGFEPQVLPVWVDVHRPQWYDQGHSTQDSIPRMVCDLKIAIDVLCAEIPGEVASQLNAVFGHLDDHNDLITKLFDGISIAIDVEETCSGIISLCHQVQTLASRALKPENHLRPWYALGWALGNWWCRNYFNESNTPTPGFRSILDAINQLPAEEIAVTETVGELSHLVGNDKLDNEQLLFEVFRILSSDDLAAPIATPFSAHCRIRDLHSRIESELLGRGLRPNHPPFVTPRWDEVTGRLWFRGEAVRRIAREAERVVEVLNVFEAAGWPSKVSMPSLVKYTEVMMDENNTPAYVADMVRSRKKDTLRSLNHDLKLIAFRGAGTKYEISWHC